MKNRVPYTVAGLLCCCLVSASLAQEGTATNQGVEDFSAQIQERRRSKATSQQVKQLRKDALAAEEEYTDAEASIPQIRKIDEEIDELMCRLVALRRERRAELEKHAKKLEKVKVKRSRVAEELRTSMSDDEETQALVRQQQALFEAQMDAALKASKKDR